MKKILILILVFAYCNVKGQTDTSTYPKKVDYLFQNISQTKFGGSVLYDRAAPIVDLQYFGVEKYNTSSRNHWEQAYYELQIASNQLNHKLKPHNFLNFQYSNTTI